jgi:hypothetical protein
VIVLAHGGTAGAVAEATFLALPVVLFFLLSKWSKRRARKVEELERADPKGKKPPGDGKTDKNGGAGKSGGPA